MATVTRREFWDRLELALYGKTGNTFGAATMIGIDELYDDLAARALIIACCAYVVIVIVAVWCDRGGA